MKLVVGLGNPGRQYQTTRHNVGYEVLEALTKREAVGDRIRRFSGALASFRRGAEKIWMLWPETYMNLSGRSVQPAMAFYGILPPDLLVVCDDLNLPLGQLRVRASGRDGGQKGLRSIAEQLGHIDYARLRIGIGPKPPHWDAADFVLARFTKDELDVVRDAIERACDATLLWCTNGIEECMNRYNAKTRS